jgi:hypothetical protein
MHYAVLNRATVRVANTRDISGRLTAASINDGAPAQTRSSLWRACRLTIFCSVVSVGVLASLTPVPALAEGGGVPEEIAALKNQVAALQSAVATLQTSNSALQSQVNALQTQLAVVQSNKALALGPFVSVNPNPENGVIGPNITFKGANIHIVSGSGVTDDHLSTGGSLTGRGNLIIGYDEAPPEFLPPLGPGDRGGSHNLVIGLWNRFTNAAFGGLVAGELNTISNQAASVSGGELNTADGIYASVSGGGSNTASNFADSVSGGANNHANGGVASISGGTDNDANGPAASVSGGAGNRATGIAASVSGGQFNVANGPEASVSGGSGNTAIGSKASVCGGTGNTAAGFEAVVIGGSNITDNNDNSIAPGAPLNYP